MKLKQSYYYLMMGAVLIFIISCGSLKHRRTDAVADSSPIKPTVVLPRGYNLVWHEEFDGNTINPQKWEIKTGTWKGGYVTKEALTVANGVLRIHTYTDDAGTHCTGYISTRGGRFSATHGFFEARINFHGVPGYQGAFWLLSPTMGNPVGDSRLAGTEIDIQEHRLQNQTGQRIDNTVSNTIHWDGYGIDHKSVGHMSKMPVSLNNSWHTYAVLWTTDQYIFYVDGIERWRTSEAPSDAPAYILLSSAIKNTLWSGVPPAKGYGPLRSSPFGMEVDWVRVWQK